MTRLTGSDAANGVVNRSSKRSRPQDVSVEREVVVSLVVVWMGDSWDMGKVVDLSVVVTNVNQLSLELRG
jgi:outer membrane receptor for ferrienterochelin and colicin